MKEIKCPHCGKQFTIDESGYLEIVNQIKDQQFASELKAREESLKKQLEAENKLSLSESSKENDALKATIKELNLTIEALRNQREVDISKAIQQKENDNIELAAALRSAQEKMGEMKKDFSEKLKIELELAESKAKSESQEEISKLRQENSKLAYSVEDIKKDNKIVVQNMAEKHSIELRQKDEQISYYKDLKTKLSTKLVGETLEQHCMNLFNQIRMTAFPKAYFEKDNDASSGSKGDFIFKDFIDDEHPYISIMFEMKNENDTTATKHKNEDFFKELDKDRNEKGCEYAVLVSMLEPESEFYNAGIVDVSYKYPKMYVIRPQCFISMITLLRNAALNSMQYQKELIAIKSQNLDIENFEDKLKAAQQGFEYNYNLANKKFVNAIERIDQTIEYLTKVKEDLLGTDKNLRLANSKLQDVSIKSLTRNNPTMKKLFEEVKKEEK